MKFFGVLLCALFTCVCVSELVLLISAISSIEKFLMGLVFLFLSSLTLFISAPLNLQAKPSQKFSALFKWFPGFLFLIVVLFAYFTANKTSGNNDSSLIFLSYSTYIICFLIPIVEEYLFRGHLSKFLGNHIGWWAGRYVSIICFSFLHTWPRFTDFSDMSFGLAIGPLLLGIFCELSVWATAKLYPAILLHMVCNGSLYLLILFDSSWMDRLSFLYG